MTISFRQLITASVTSATPTTVFLPSAPLPGSALIAVVGCLKPVRPTLFRHGAVDWNLLYEHDGLIEADQQALEAVRVQVWGAFDLPAGASAQIGIDFSGGTSDRGIILAEYTGDVFQFPNPADRVGKKSGSTAPATPGTIDTAPATAEIREDVELLIGGVATDQAVTLSNPGLGYTLRSQAGIGATPDGTVGLLERVTFTPVGIRIVVDHSADPSGVNWVGVGAGTRGNLQVPAEEVDAPAVSEPVTEFVDYSGDGIGKLISQLRAKT